MPDPAAPFDPEQVPSPCFVVDLDRLDRNLAVIDDARAKSGAEIVLALKGFSLWRLFHRIGRRCDGGAASSLYEARLIRDHLKKPVHAYCPAYSPADIGEICSLSSHVSFNSLAEFGRYNHVVSSRGSGRKKPSAGIRLNPGYSPVKTALYNPAGHSSRLGIQPAELYTGGAAPDRILPPGIEGLHFHALCESSAADLAAVLESFVPLYGPLLRSGRIAWVNMGGGHLVTRAGYDIDLLVRTVRSFASEFNVRVILEPGAAFVWETGFLAATVLDIVERGPVPTAVLDVSFTAHMPDCLEMPYKPAIIGADSSGENEGYRYRMGGNSCLAGDVMGEWSFPRRLSPGERIVFNDMAHYTMVKTTMFNGVRHPAIGTWSQSQGFRLLRKYTYGDYKRRMD